MFHQAGESLRWKTPHNGGVDMNPLSLPTATDPATRDVVSMLGAHDPFRHGAAPLSNLSSYLLPAQLESLRFLRNSSYDSYLASLTTSPSLRDPLLLVTLPPPRPNTFSPSLQFNIGSTKVNISPTFKVSSVTRDFDLYVADLGRVYGLDLLTMGVIRQDIEKAYRNTLTPYSTATGKTGEALNSENFEVRDIGRDLEDE